MELAQKLKQARLDAGLSQKAICGDRITRNMLSQIENGSARPSMETLRYLAGQLGKPISYFLEDDAVTSPNQTLMEQARSASPSDNGRRKIFAILLSHTDAIGGQHEIREKYSDSVYSESVFFCF